MKILYVTNMYPTADHIYNGIHVKEQIEHLVSKYHFEHEIYFINGRKSRLNYIKSIFCIYRRLKKNTFDLIHIHFGLSGFFLFFIPFINIPIVVTLHGSDINTNASFLMKRISKFAVWRSTKVIILNDTIKAILRKYNNKLLKIPCGINIAQFSIERSNNLKNTFTIGFPGDKNRPGKNYKLFAGIICELQKSHIIKVVEFHNMTRTQVSKNLSQLDCLLMTSISEGSPQIIKEAMVCNLPIVSSKVGDVDDLLSGVQNSYVIDSFEKEPYIRKLNEIIALTPVERKSNGLKKIRKLGLDQDSVGLKIYKIYNDLLRNEKEN